MQTRWLLLCLVVCMVACTGDTVPVAPDAIAPEVVAESSGGVTASGGNSGCYTVKFKISGPAFPTQTVSGDIQGTGVAEFDTFKFTGKTVAIGGVFHWFITDGVLGPLEFDTTLDNRNQLVDRPGSSELVFENTGKHRAVEGVRKANLTYHGTATQASPTAVLILDHDYNGVICP